MRPAPPTLPHVRPVQAGRGYFVRRSRRGCNSRIGMIIGVLLLAPIFLCGISLVMYVLFPPPPLDILVLGLDARGNEGFMSRTDSVMLVGVNPRGMRVSLLSLPRDLFINVPDYGMERINTVNVLGEMEQTGYGPTLLGTALERNFGVGVDRYVRLDFDGFRAMIDAVGGVEINVEQAIVDYQYPTEDFGTMEVRFEPGWQHMDGERALIYARTRHSDDDYERARRQQQVVSALGIKMLNPLNWGAVGVVWATSVDTNMSVIDLARIAPPVLFGMGNYEQLVVDRAYITRDDTGNAIPNYSAVNPWVEPRFD